MELFSATEPADPGNIKCIYVLLRLFNKIKPKAHTELSMKITQNLSYTLTISSTDIADLKKILSGGGKILKRVIVKGLDKGICLRIENTLKYIVGISTR